MIKTVARMFELLKEELEHFKVEFLSKVRKKEKIKIKIKYTGTFCLSN